MPVELGAARILVPTGIRRGDVMYGDQEAAHFVWTSGISRDPFVEFSLVANREAPLKITWKDNRGGAYEQAVEIRFI
jgi:hypothetical protein